MQPHTPEEVRDFDQRSKSFMGEVQPLLDKYQLVIEAVPELVPTQNGVFVVAGKVTFRDLKFVPKPPSNPTEMSANGSSVTPALNPDA